MPFSPPPVTGWSSFWGNAPNSYSMLFGRTSPERSIALALAKPGMRQLRSVMRALNGAVAGSPANETYKRVAHSVQGGVRTIETVVASSGNTTAAQQAYIQDEILDRIFNSAPATYPADTSGNGGGGKLGY